MKTPNLFVACNRKNENKEFNPIHSFFYARKACLSHDMDTEHTPADIAQDAFIRYWESRKEGRVPLTTKQATRYAFRQYRRDNRVRSAKPKEGERISARICQCRRHSPPRATSADAKDFDAIELVSAVERETLDCTPDADGTKTASVLRTMVRWLVTGAKVQDVAEHCGVSPEYISKLRRTLQERFPDHLFERGSSTQETRPETPMIPHPELAIRPAVERNLFSPEPSMRPVDLRDTVMRKYPRTASLMKRMVGGHTFHELLTAIRENQ